MQDPVYALSMRGVGAGFLNANQNPDARRGVEYAFIDGKHDRHHPAQERLLTDSGLLQLHQKERAPFVDPFQFRLLVNSGQIHPDVILEVLLVGDGREVRALRGLVQRRARRVARSAPGPRFLRRSTPWCLRAASL